MNATNRNQSLRLALRVWQVRPSVDAGFRGAVWARIDAARECVETTWTGYVRYHLGAWVLVLGLVAIGAGALGIGVGAKHSAADRELVLASYVAAIDARAMEP